LHQEITILIKASKFHDSIICQNSKFDPECKLPDASNFPKALVHKTKRKKMSGN